MEAEKTSRNDSPDVRGTIPRPISGPSGQVESAAIESALVSHAKVAEAVVAALTLEWEGSALCAFVRVKEGVSESAELKQELADYLAAAFGPAGFVHQIRFTSVLPRTRSGKIERRLLNELAAHGRS